MMSTNLASAENGGQESDQNTWWLARWSSQLACLGGTILLFTGALSLVWEIAKPRCWLPPLIQILAASTVLAIEGSTLVTFPAFTKPVSRFFEGKPIWLKTAVYAVLTILPMTFDCSGIFLTLGFLVSAGITALYGMLLIGRKAQLDEMRQSAAQPTSP